MGKRQTEQTYQDTRRERQETEQELDAAQLAAGQRATQLAGGNDAMGGELYAGYGNLDRLGPATQLEAPIFTAREIGYAPEVSTSNLTETRGRWQNFADNPIEADALGRITGDIQNIRNTGTAPLGIDENRIRGGGVYDEFASTGGLSQTDRSNIRTRALSPIGSYATGTRDELARRAAVQGGYAPGFDAANRQLQRDTARAITDTSLNAELGILNQVNQGRLAGAAGLTATESNLANVKLADLQRQAAAAGQSAQLEQQLADLTARYRAMGLSGEQAAGQAIADIEAINAQNQLSVNMFNANAANQAGMFNAGNAMQAGMFNIGNEIGIGQFNAGQQQAGLAGQTGIFNTNIGREEAARDREQQILLGGAGINTNNLSNQGQLAVQPGVGGTVLGAVTGAAGAVAPWFVPRARPAA